MINWKDGVKINDAYVNEDGTITEAEYESETPLSAHLLNLMQKIDTVTIILESDTVISNGKELELPLKYQVGNHSLEVRLNTEVLKLATDTEDGHYKEVGEAGSLSNKIAFYRTKADGNWTLSEPVTITAIVHGVSQEGVSENGENN